MDKQQLLIVDDEEVNRAILSMMFKHDRTERRQSGRSRNARISR